ncbi:MAG: hypothetical protein E7378_02200 [Clostridiales bacterium]|nr:hypothetical protein [Clostridiales bacterium]
MIRNRFDEITEEKRIKRHSYIYAYLLNMSMDYNLCSNAFRKHKGLFLRNINPDPRELTLIKQMEKDIQELTEIYNELKGLYENINNFVTKMCFNLCKWVVFYHFLLVCFCLVLFVKNNLTIVFVLKGLRI